MYVCVYVHMYVRMYVTCMRCLFVCLHACMFSVVLIVGSGFLGQPYAFSELDEAAETLKTAPSAHAKVWTRKYEPTGWTLPEAYPRNKLFSLSPY